MSPLCPVRRCPKPIHPVTTQETRGDRPLVAGDGRAWDAVILVRYPSREAYSRMVADAGYRELTSMLTTAFYEAVLQSTIPWLDL